jgi:hypothetical protein
METSYGSNRGLNEDNEKSMILPVELTGAELLFKSSPDSSLYISISSVVNGFFVLLPGSS